MGEGHANITAHTGKEERKIVRNFSRLTILPCPLFFPKGLPARYVGALNKRPLPVTMHASASAGSVHEQLRITRLPVAEDSQHVKTAGYAVNAHMIPDP